MRHAPVKPARHAPTRPVNPHAAPRKTRPCARYRQTRHAPARHAPRYRCAMRPPCTRHAPAHASPRAHEPMRPLCVNHAPARLSANHAPAHAPMHAPAYAPAPIPARIAHGKTRPPIDARIQKNPLNSGQFLGFNYAYSACHCSSKPAFSGLASINSNNSPIKYP